VSSFVKSDKETLTWRCRLAVVLLWISRQMDSMSSLLMRAMLKILLFPFMASIHERQIRAWYCEYNPPAVFAVDEMAAFKLNEKNAVGPACALLASLILAVGSRTTSGHKRTVPTTGSHPGVPRFEACTAATGHRVTGSPTSFQRHRPPRCVVCAQHLHSLPARNTIAHSI